MQEYVLKNEKGGTIIVQQKDFWGYAAQKKITRDDLWKLKVDKREDFFMKWKHGMTDMNTNWEFEYALRHFLKQFEGISLDGVDVYFRKSLELKRNFDEYCNTIKVQLGIWVRRTDVPKPLQELADKVGGTVVMAELLDPDERVPALTHDQRKEQ